MPYLQYKVYRRLAMDLKIEKASMSPKDNSLYDITVVSPSLCAYDAQNTILTLRPGMVIRFTRPVL